MNGIRSLFLIMRNILYSMIIYALHGSSHWDGSSFWGDWWSENWTPFTPSALGGRRHAAASSLQEKFLLWASYYSKRIHISWGKSVLCLGHCPFLSNFFPQKMSPLLSADACEDLACIVKLSWCFPDSRQLNEPIGQLAEFPSRERKKKVKMSGDLGAISDRSWLVFEKTPGIHPQTTNCVEGHAGLKSSNAKPRPIRAADLHLGLETKTKWPNPNDSDECLFSPPRPNFNLCTTVGRRIIICYKLTIWRLGYLHIHSSWWVTTKDIAVTQPQNYTHPTWTSLFMYFLLPHPLKHHPQLSRQFRQ